MDSPERASSGSVRCFECGGYWTWSEAARETGFDPAEHGGVTGAVELLIGAWRQRRVEFTTSDTEDRADS